MTRLAVLTVGLGSLLLAIAQPAAAQVATAQPAAAQVAVQGEMLYTMAGAPIPNGVVVITDGKISAVGPADKTPLPAGVQVLKAKIVTPGLIDAHSTLGLSGMLNSAHDQDQLEHSAPIQPALRAVDAYNAQDPLIPWVRSFGVTSVHTGHAPGELISGQTMVVKTVGNTVDEALVVPAIAIACSLGSDAHKSGNQSPGTRGKMMSMLRAELIKAQEYQTKLTTATEKKDPAAAPPRDLHLEALSQVLRRELVLLITADRATDIANALRLAREFNIRIWLDSAAESYLLIDEIKAAGVPVLIHPTMARATEDRENLSFETAAKLLAAGIPVAMQSGHESYVPKARIVLFEAARAAAEGLSFEQALSTITNGAAKILGIDKRVGSLEVGKDGDVALYDGDPFEYTSHCVGVVIDGRIVSRETR
ncbi:MAG: amidohydrolase family protein [Pirellulaceae bacterium]